MVKGDKRAINSAYLLGQCLGPPKVGPYYVRHIKAEQASAPERLIQVYLLVQGRREEDKI